MFKTIINKLVKIPVENDGRIKLAAVVVGALKVLQSWPTDNVEKPSTKNKLCYSFVFLYCNIIVAGLWGHVIKLYVSGHFNYNDLAIDFAILTLGISGYQYCSYLYRHRFVAQELLSELGDFRVYEKPPGIEIADAVLNAIYKSIIITVIILTPILLWTLLSESCEEDNYYCGFLYPAYIPGMMTSYRRKCFLVVQLTSAWTYVLLGTGCVWVGMHMAEYLCLYLKHCQSMTKDILMFDDYNQRKEQVKRVLRYHQRILYLHKKYRKVAKGMFVVHAISTPVVMAMMMYTFMIDFQVQCFLIFAIWTMTMFVVCYMGQRMINESDVLANVVYDTIPFDGDLYTTKALCFMLLQTQIPLMVPAGSLTYCGYPLFLTAIKATYSYLALLRQTRN